MNHHATLSNPNNNRRKYSIGVVYRLCNNLPLLLAILFLVSRMGFSFSPSFINKKRPNRFALHSEVQLRQSLGDGAPATLEARRLLQTLTKR